MKFQQARDEVIRFHKENKAIAAVVWFAASLLTSIFMLRHSADIVPTAMFASILAFMATGTLARYRAALDKRINAEDSFTWTVSVNGIDADEISDARYARIRRNVFFDVRLYVAQFANVMGCLCRALDSLIWTLPILVFWGAAGCYFFAPESFATALHAIQTVTKDELVSAIPAAVNLLVMVSFLYLMVSMVGGRNFGFVNRFDEAVAADVRRFINCPAEGYVNLHRWLNGSLQHSRERDHLRAEKG